MRNQIITIRIFPPSGLCVGSKGSWEIIGGLQIPGEEARKCRGSAIIYSDPEWSPNYCGPVPPPPMEDFV